MMNFHSDKHFEIQDAFEIFFRKFFSSMLLQKVNFYETTFFIKKKEPCQSLSLGVWPISVSNDKSVCTITPLTGFRSQ